MANNTNTKPEVEYRQCGSIWTYRTGDMKTFAPLKDEKGNIVKVHKIPKII